ncbi:hypothetical protein TNCV_2166691 [Trichonephila clavipes]|nr:hypothetical protein TNCV_2166691 [Trichonephila clavipes]
MYFTSTFLEVVVISLREGQNLFPYQGNHIRFLEERAEHAGSIAHELSFLSALSSQNRDSPLCATRFQSSTLQSLCSVAQSRRAARWRALSNDIPVGRRLPKPLQ